MIETKQKAVELMLWAISKIRVEEKELAKSMVIQLCIQMIEMSTDGNQIAYWNNVVREIKDL